MSTTKNGVKIIRNGAVKGSTLDYFLQTRKAVFGWHRLCLILSSWKFLQFLCHCFQDLRLGWGWDAEQQVPHNSDNPQPSCHVLMILLQVWKVFSSSFYNFNISTSWVILVQQHGILFSFSFKIWLTFPLDAASYKVTSVWPCTSSDGGPLSFVKLSYQFCQLSNPHSLPLWKTFSKSVWLWLWDFPLAILAKHHPCEDSTHGQYPTLQRGCNCGWKVPAL